MPDMIAAKLVVDDRDMMMITPNEQPSGDVSAGETDLAENAAQKGEKPPETK